MCVVLLYNNLVAIVSEGGTCKLYEMVGQIMTCIVNMISDWEWLRVFLKVASSKKYVFE